MMNAEARKLGLRDTHFANPDGLDAAGHYSSARDVTRLARIAMKNPVIRSIVGAARRRRSPAAATLTHLERPARRASRACSASRPATRAPRAGRRSPRRASHGVTIYATLLGRHDARGPERRPRRPARLGARAVPHRRRRSRRRASTRRRTAPYGRTRARARRAAAGDADRPGRPAAGRTGGRSDRSISLPVRKGERSERCGSTRDTG